MVLPPSQHPSFCHHQAPRLTASFQFHEEYIRQGIDGGKKAAYDLRRAVADKCGDLAAEIEIVAKVYANLSGLSKAMRRDGSIDAESDLKEFTLGFTQAKASFDFVDVGHGKERADSKIKGMYHDRSPVPSPADPPPETARWNLKNTNCKHILMGVSHDAGYAPFLDDVMQDEDTRSCMTVIEGVPTVRELRRTNVNIIHLDHIFRNDKLVDRTGIMGAVIAPFTDSSYSRQNSIAMTSTTTSASSPSNPGASPPSTWAVITGKASPPPQISLPLAHKKINNNLARAPSQVLVAKPPSPSWDPGARGLDPVISCNQAVLDTIKKRKDSAKLCNNHYLRGPCTKGSECCFEHKYRPNPEELKAIAFLARLNPCTKGQDCDVDNCIYGHHVSTPRDGPGWSSASNN